MILFQIDRLSSLIDFAEQGADTFEHFADSMIGAYDVSEGCLYSTAPVPRRRGCPSRLK
jgi:hypothetical protein